MFAISAKVNTEYGNFTQFLLPVNLNSIRSELTWTNTNVNHLTACDDGREGSVGVDNLKIIHGRIESSCCGSIIFRWLTV